MKENKGITLIALIITIIIMVILAAIAVRGLVGDNNLIDSTEKATNNYKIAANKESMEFAVRAYTIESATSGEYGNIRDLAKYLSKQEGVKSVEIIEENEDGSGRLLITMNDGSIYEIYYDPIQGIIKVEYIGTEKNIGGDSSKLKKCYPVVKADLKEGNIIAKATVEDTNIKIEKMELIYNGQVQEKETKTGEEARGIITYTGLEEYGAGEFRVRATTEKGLQGYSYPIKIRSISEFLPTPKIIVTSHDKADGKNGWYITGPVEVKIEANPSIAKEIHYTLNTAGEQIETSGVVELNFETSGLYQIRAWTEDGEGSRSKGETSKEIMLDLIEPEIKGFEIKGPKSEDGEWLIGPGEIEVKAEDAGGRLSGYTWEAYKQEGVLYKKSERTYSMEEKIAVNTDGIYSVAVTVFDESGRESEVKSVNVQKDSKAPNITEGPTLSGETGTSFIVNLTVSDETSGIDKYVAYINGITRPEWEWTGTTQKTITNLKAETDYNVQVYVYDNAGNEGRSGITSTTTLMSLPIVGITGDETKWVTSRNVTFSTSNDKDTVVKYTLDATEPSILNGTEYTGQTITLKSNTTVKAIYYNKRTGQTSLVVTKEAVNIDSVQPVASINTIDVASNSLTVNIKATVGVSGVNTYYCYYSSDNGASYTPLTSTTNSSILIDRLIAGKEYYIKVKIKNGAGIESVESPVTIQKTKGNIPTPSISAVSTGGSGNWYGIGTGINITKLNTVSDDISNKTIVIFTTEGSSTHTDKTFAETTGKCELLPEAGKYIVYAYYTDSTGKVKGANSQPITFYYDATRPGISSPSSAAVSGTTNQVKFTATVSDSGGSGLGSCIFKTNLANYNPDTAISGNSSSAQKTVTTRGPGDTITCTLEVKDGAGNTTTQALTSVRSLQYTWEKFATVPVYKYEPVSDWCVIYTCISCCTRFNYLDSGWSHISLGRTECDKTCVYYDGDSHWRLNWVHGSQFHPRGTYCPTLIYRWGLRVWDDNLGGGPICNRE